MITEGIEDGLSIHQATGLPHGRAGGTSQHAEACRQGAKRNRGHLFAPDRDLPVNMPPMLIEKLIARGIRVLRGVCNGLINERSTGFKRHTTEEGEEAIRDRTSISRKPYNRTRRPTAKATATMATNRKSWPARKNRIKSKRKRKKSKSKSMCLSNWHAKNHRCSSIPATTKHGPILSHRTP